MFTYEFVLINGEAALYSVTGKLKFIQNLPQWFRNFCGWLFVYLTWSFCIIDFM